MVGEINLKPKNNELNNELKKSNFRVLYSYVDDNGNKIQGSKKFYSSNELDMLFSELSKLEDKEGNKTKIVIRDLNNIKSKGKYFKIPNCVLTDSFKETIMGLKGFVDTRVNRYRVIIDDLSSKQTDKKSLTIQCPESLDDVTEKLERLVKRIAKEQTDDFIIFMDEDNKKLSHSFYIHKSGCEQDYKCFKGKSFSIRMPNFSSSEIRDLIMNEINGGN